MSDEARERRSEITWSCTWVGHILIFRIRIHKVVRSTRDKQVWCQCVSEIREFDPQMMT